MIEVVVALAILVLLSGIVVPRLIGTLRQGQAGALASTFNGLSEAILAFRGDTGRYPRRISLLATPITSTSKDSCGSTIADSASWKGPYLDRAINATAGIVVGPAVVSDSLRRTPGTATSTVRVGTLTIVATGVEQQVADELEKALDGNANLSAGTVQWSSAGDGTLSYNMVVRGC